MKQLKDITIKEVTNVDDLTIYEIKKGFNFLVKVYDTDEMVEPINYVESILHSLIYEVINETMLRDRIFTFIYNEQEYIFGLIVRDKNYIIINEVNDI